MSLSGNAAAQEAGSLTFWGWLRQMPRDQRPSGLLHLALGVAVGGAAMVVTMLVADWLFLPPEGGGRSFVHSIFPPMWAGAFAMFTMVMAAPEGRRATAAACLAALLTGIAAVAGMIGSLAIGTALAEHAGMSGWVAAAVWSLGMLAGIPMALAAAYRFRSPAPVIRPEPADTPATVGVMVIIVAGGFLAAAGFVFVHRMTAPADCGPPVAAGLFGSLAFVSSGQVLFLAWLRAGTLRGALLREWGLGMLILLAAVPLGHLFQCEPLAAPGPMADSRADRALILQLFGGYALPVYIAAGILAAWRMDRFLARHRLRWQDRAEMEKEDPA